MKVTALLSGLMAATVIAGSAQAASLAGDTISINLFNNADFGTQMVLVGPDGVGADANYFSNQYVDLNASVDGDEFTLTSSNVYCGISCSGRVIWTLSSLDFGVPLTGFTILQSISPVTIDSLTATSVTFSYDDVSIPSGTYFRGRFETGASAVVPEPSTWAMMIMGFGALGAMVRRRRGPATA